MTYTDPATVHDPAGGLIIPSAWGDVLNQDLQDHEARLISEASARAAALAAHEADTTLVHGITDTADLAHKSGAETMTGLKIFSGGLALPGYTKAGLPAAGNVGRLARVTNEVRGVWMDQGSQWFGLNGEVVNAKEFGVVVNSAGAAAANTTALNNALAQATVGGKGTVLLPPGIIYWDGLVNIPQGVSLVGMGIAATVFLATASASQIRFGDGGGTTVAENYFGWAGHFYVNGNSIATNGLFIGLSIHRVFHDIRSANSVGDGIRIEQAQNCLFSQIFADQNGGSGVVLDYGAGGHAFYKCEFYKNGYANGRSTYSGANTGGGYTSTKHNLFSQCLFEGTKATTVACFDQGAGERLTFDQCHFTLFGGTQGHADLYGTNIPVYRQWKEHADVAAVSNGAHFKGGTWFYGSKPSVGVVYKGIGLDISSSPSALAANCVLDDGTVIANCNVAVKAADNSIVNETGQVFKIDNTTRFAAQTGSTVTEGDTCKARHGYGHFVGVDPTDVVVKIDRAAGQMVDMLQFRASDGGLLSQISNSGSFVSSLGGVFVGDAIQGIRAQLSGRGTAAAPAFTFSNDPDCGMWSPGGNLLAFSAGGVESLRLALNLITLADAQDLALGSTTGTKIGTATTQKLGFFNKTPVVQPAAILTPPAPSVTYIQAEAAAMKTAVDAIRTTLINLGLTA